MKNKKFLIILSIIVLVFGAYLFININSDSSSENEDYSVNVKDKQNNHKQDTKSSISNSKPKKFDIEEDKISVSEKDNYSLTYDANSKDIIWSSTDDTIASVKSNGTVVGKKEGKAVVKGTDKNGKQDTVAVTVVNKKENTTSKKVNTTSNKTNVVSNKVNNKYIKFNKQQLTLNNKEKYQLTVDTNISGNIVWKSSNESIATVDKNGLIVAKKPGDTVITAKSNNIQATCYVSVVDPVKHVEKITIDKTNVTLKIGESLSVKATILPLDADNTDATWKSNNNKIATVNNSGKITAISEGNTDVTITSIDGNKVAKVNVTVNKVIPEKVVVTSSKTSLNVSESVNLTATISPSNATDKTVKYSSSNTSVISVSETGKVNALAPGTAIITVESSNGLKSQITLNVIKEADSKTSSKTFTAKFEPNGSTGSVTTKTCKTSSTSCDIKTPSITRSGYNILGWSTNKDASTATVKANESLKISSNVTYYAITSKEVKATFNKNTITSDLKLGSTSKTCVIRNANTSCSITLPTITRSGFTILGWSTSSNGGSEKTVGSNVSLSANATYYAITKVAADGNIVGATGYSALNGKEYLYQTASSSSKRVLTLEWGVPFTILSVTGDYWYISYKGTLGYVLNKYCMINLPDYIPSMSYDITNSYSSIYKSSGYNIPNVTGSALYGFKKSYNKRLGRNEFIAPIMYPTAKQVLSAQKTALANGYSLKLYDSYRPKSVSTKMYTNLTNLYNSNSTVKKNINYSTGASGTKYSWGQSWFLAKGLSAHNVGAAVDITLTKKGSSTDLSMPTKMHELSTAAIKYYSSSAAHKAANFSVGMLKSTDAQKLHTYMTGAGLTDLSSEWWHFQNNESYNLIKGKESNGCDFTPQGIVSQ